MTPPSPAVQNGLIRSVTGLGLALFVLLEGPAPAAVIVNSPLEITHHVQIQPIVTKKSDGTTAAFLGNASTESYIKGEIDRVWAQSGLVIEWLPPVDYVSDFAYDGSPADYRDTNRPQSDLGTILNGTGSPPKNSDGTVINMFFVEIVPGFSRLSEYTANGLARVDRNGITVQVGTELLTWTGGRDVVASVIGHEIGHNLGLSHAGNGESNLMSPGGDTDQVTTSQTATVFTNNGGVDGYDFLFEAVEETNYMQWAAAFGVTGGPEGDHDGDLIANVIEFMLGLQGTIHDSLPQMVPGDEGLTWTLPKVDAALQDGLDYAVELSPDGTNWYPTGSDAVPHTVVADNSAELVVRAAAGQPRAFMRLQVQVPVTLQAASRTFLPLERAEELNAGIAAVVSACGIGSCGCRTLHPE